MVAVHGADRAAQLQATEAEDVDLSDEAEELADEVSQQAASSTAAMVRSVLPEAHAAPAGRPAWQMGAAGLVGLAIVGAIVIMAKKLLNKQLPKVQAVRLRAGPEDTMPESH